MKLNDLDFHKINVFCSVVKNGDYAAASEDLALSRSAISQSVTLLEDNLGVPLFHRTGKRLIPTEKGLSLFNEFTRHQESLDSRLHQILYGPENVKGEVKIGAYLEFAKSQLMPHLVNFINTHTGCRFRFLFYQPSQLDRMLDEHQIDMAFSIYPHPKSESTPLFEEELVMVGARDLLPDSPTWEELKTLSFIDYYQNHRMIDRWFKFYFNKNAKNLSVKVFAGTADMVLELVKNKVGLGVVPRYVLERSFSETEIVIVRPSSKKLKDYIWLNEHADDYGNPAHKAFSQLVRRYFNP